MSAAPAGAAHDADLRAHFELQRAAFEQERGLSLEQRRAALTLLRRAVKGKATELSKAVSEDFGGRSPHETAIAELGVLLAAIDHAVPRLPRWAKPERVSLGWRWWPARGLVLKEPLGVAGILAPWNYPVQLALMPVVGALAAGCRAMVKPSELTPATSELLARTVGEAFAPDTLGVVLGGPAVAAAFSALPFDKLLFTGSERVGRQVMAAAAPNLTPVILELGGKSPVIIDPSANLQEAAEAVMAGKLLNAGQTCVAPDYVLVPAGLRDEFVDLCRAAAQRLYPDPAGPDYTAIHGTAARERLLRLQRGCVAVPLFDQVLVAPKLAPAILLEPPRDSQAMREEIFGPLLPVISYETPDEAIELVRSLPAPLALYWFGQDRARLQPVVERTRSGSVAVNETVLHVAAEALPFGGVGGSGFGAYHGRAGFESFTHRRAVFTQGRLRLTRYARPPYGATADRLTAFLLR